MVGAVVGGGLGDGAALRLAVVVVRRPLGRRVCGGESPYRYDATLITMCSPPAQHLPDPVR